MKDIIKHLATLYKKKNLKSITSTLKPKLFWQRHPIEQTKKGTRIYSGRLKNQIVSKFEQSKQGVSQKDSFQSFKISNQYTFICVVFQRAWSAEFTAHNFHVFLILNFYMHFFGMISEHISTYQSWQSST